MIILSLYVSTVGKGISTSSTTFMLAWPTGRSLPTISCPTAKDLSRFDLP